MRKYQEDFSESPFENMRELSSRKVRKKKVKQSKEREEQGNKPIQKKRKVKKDARVKKVGLFEQAATTKSLTIALIILILMVAICGILLFVTQNQGLINVEKPTPSPTVVPSVEPTVAPTPTPEPTLDTTLYDTKTFGSITQVVNKHQGLTASNVPNDQVFVGVRATIDKMTLRKEANDALVLMFEAADNAGIELYVNEAYVSYYYQNDLYKNYANLVGKDYADMVTPHQGYSEHQTGLAVDIISKENGKFTHLNSSLRSKRSPQECEESQAALWLKENAHTYGFIQRYPEGKEDITGYYGQWWHYRYVGTELATYMTEKDLCMEELFNMPAGSYQ